MSARDERKEKRVENIGREREESVSARDELKKKKKKGRNYWEGARGERECVG